MRTLALSALSFIVLALAVIGVGPLRAAPQADCPAHYPEGKPLNVDGRGANARNTTLLCRRAYAMLHDNQRKVPLWVAYELTSNEAFGCFERKDRFKPDPDLKAGKRAELADYAAASDSYDRGHVAPADDMLESIPIMRESFYLSNMTPQVSALNRGLWSKIEQAVHVWAADRDGLAIVTGPVFAGNARKSIGDDKVAVPTAYYKVVYDRQANVVVSFLVPNKSGAGHKYPDFVRPLKEVEQATGLDLLPNVTPAPRDLAADELWPVDVKTFRSQRMKFCRAKLKNGWRAGSGLPKD